MKRTLSAALALLLTAQLAPAQMTTGDKVEPVSLPLDRAGVWTFHMKYKAPRIVTVNVPGQGKKTAWYMIYQVWNTSDTPETFVPLLELVTKDGPLQTFLDEPQPTVLDQIRKVEDPTGELKLKSSVQMSDEKIPVTKVDSVPNVVTGVAIWVDAPEKAATTNNFTVFVTGLSNGITVEQSPDGGETVRRKTLQIDFIKPTDNASAPRMNDIRPNENGGLGAWKWIYRVTPVMKKG